MKSTLIQSDLVSPFNKPWQCMNCGTPTHRVHTFDSDTITWSSCSEECDKELPTIYAAIMKNRKHDHMLFSDGLGNSGWGDMGNIFFK